MAKLGPIELFRSQKEKAMKTVRVACWIWLACALAACSGDKKLELGGTCTLNSDCTQPLLCKLGSCRKACVRSIDCENGGRCVTVDGVAVCQTEKESSCDSTGNCPTPLVCRTVDNTCRTACSPTNDTCVGGQTCNGTVCLENRELANPGSDAGAGAIDGAGTPDAATVVVADAAAGPDAGAAGPDLPVAQPDTAAPDVPLAPSDAASADVPLAKPDAAADAPGDSGVATDTSGSAKPDTSPPNECASCTPGQACVAGKCVACGRSAGQPCCDVNPACGANLTCTATNQCACGDQDQACCGGNTCTAEFTCSNGTCACGAAGKLCCADKSCTTGNFCAGVRCGCVKACSLAWYQKTDGTVGRSDDSTYKLQAADGTTFADPAVTISGNDPSGGKARVCITKDGSVWCAGSNANGALGAGDTSATSSQKLVRVVTGIGGSPLTGIKKVVLGSDFSDTSCALSNAGEIWCWGDGSFGQLGTGFVGGSSFAIPVLDSPGGAHLSGAVDVGVGYHHACAAKIDGTAWCWGDNGQGQLGTGDTSSHYSPTQVSNLEGKEIVAVSASSFASYDIWTCAVARDGYVWCWGDNGFGMLGPDGGTGSNVPVRLVMAKNGAAFQDAAAISADYGYPTIQKTDGSIWTWGGSVDASGPRPLLRNGLALTGLYFAGRGCWIGGDGKMYNLDNASPTNVTCP
jgi:hypothetical protein